MPDNYLLEVKNLKVYFKVKENVFSKIKLLRAVDGVSFNIMKGEKVGLVGESGCGKTTLGRTILGLEEIYSGDIIFNGSNIAELVKKRKLRSLYKDAQFIFQDPFSSINPRFNVYSILERPLINFFKLSSNERKKRIIEMIQSVGMNSESLTKYPHEFSGGQRQRITIARALVSNPMFLIADEPTSSLDVSIQAKILQLMLGLIEKMNLSLLFISHNLAVVNQFCDKIIVMYLGKIVEIADWSTLFKNPLHYYTKALISAVPLKDTSVSIDDYRLEGSIPSPINPPIGCRLNTRCKIAKKECFETEPDLVEIEKDHFVACHYYII